MRTNVVFTLTGPDRVGIVEDVTRVLVGLNANVETSRMARLGGEFVILMMASLPVAGASETEAAFASLTAEGYRVSVTDATSGTSVTEGCATYRIELSGADHEGIVHEIARGLSSAGINIESMETGTVSSPISGTPLFTLDAIVAVPADVAETGWRDAPDEAGALAGVDITVTGVEG